MIQEVPVSESTPLEPALESQDAPEPLEVVAQPEEPSSEVPQEPEEPPPPPVPKTRVPPRVKPKAKPKAESSTPASSSAPKPKAKRAPRKPKEDPPPDETDRFASFSNTDLMSEMLKRTDQGERRNSTLHTALIAEIIARSNDHRLEQKRAMYRSFLQ